MWDLRSLVTNPCPRHCEADVKTLKSLSDCSLRSHPMDYTVHGIFQARILEWVDFPFSRGSSQPRDWTQVSPAGRFFTSWATKEANTSTWIQTPKSWLNWSWELSLVSPKKRPWCWERLRAGGEGDDRGWDGWMASLTRWTSEWTLGVGDGQGGLACCDSWGHKKSDTTEQLNWTEAPKLQSEEGMKEVLWIFFSHLLGKILTEYKIKS